jgi:hypothetical protein
VHFGNAFSDNTPFIFFFRLPAISDPSQESCNGKMSFFLFFLSLSDVSIAGKFCNFVYKQYMFLNAELETESEALDLVTDLVGKVSYIQINGICD